MKLRLLLPGLAALVLLFAACSPPPPLRDDTLLHDASLLTSAEDCATPQTVNVSPEATNEATVEASATDTVSDEATPEASATEDASIEATPEATAESGAASEALTYNVLCWHGITPGVTTWQEALTILEDDDTLENVNVQESEETDAKAAEFQAKGGATCCQVFTQDGNLVNVIFLRTAPTMTIGELIDAQGEPEYLVGSQYSEDQAVMNVIFPEKSLVVYAFVPGTSGSLTEDSEIVGVLYLTPTDMDLLIKTSNLHTWDGYKSYQAYDTSGFEVTPEITLTPTPGS